MTDGITPLYEVRILSMPIEKFAETAIDGAVWLTGEYLSQARKINSRFFLNPAYIHKPRHREVAIGALDRANQHLRHRIFVEGFRKLPESGTHGTFEDLLTTHGELVEEAFRTEWEHRLGRTQNAVQSAFSLRSVSVDRNYRCTFYDDMVGPAGGAHTGGVVRRRKGRVIGPAWLR